MCMDIVLLLLVELCFVQFIGQRTVKDCIHIVMSDAEVNHTRNCILIFCYFKFSKKKVGPLVQKLTSPWVKTKCLQSFNEL